MKTGDIVVRITEEADEKYAALTKDGAWVDFS
jgi:hypothetical protein